MLHVVSYNRRAAVEYARTWALKRNPRFMDLSNLGGDCTNFASQCLYAGSKIMNYTPDTGWYYINPTRRAPAWSGVPFLYRFLTENLGRGPFAKVVDLSEVEPGDLVQLYNGIRYYHTLVVVSTRDGVIKITTHTTDSDMRDLSSYNAAGVRPLHILGVRKPAY